MAPMRSSTTARRPARINQQVCGKNGPDVIYDPVGSKLPNLHSVHRLAWPLPGGRFRWRKAGLPLNLMLLKGASLVGVFWGEFAKREPANNQKGLAEMMGWIREGKLKPLISKTYTLEEAPQALLDVAARKVVGKVVIKP
jgi:NADPH2:quinone reductase